MKIQLLSITIRPPQAEFNAIANAMDEFIEYMKPNEYIVSLEKGLNKGHKAQFNHYQIAYVSDRHVDTIRRGLNRIFKPVLSASTLKKGVWKKCIKHNDKTSLIGYCQKEGKIYSTNIEETKLKAELERYLSRKKNKTKNKAIIWPVCRKCKTSLLCNIPKYCNGNIKIDYIFYNYFCPLCKRVRFPIFE